MKHKHNQHGFHLVAVILGLVIIAVIGLAAWKVFGSKGGGSQLSKSSGVTWYQVRDGWEHKGGSLPSCPSPLPLPVKLDNVTSILWPGQYRSNEYKAHGGFRFDNATTNNVQITAPMEAEVVRAAHYMVGKDDQYTFDLITPCGLMYRFGHLLKLGSTFQAIADKLPNNGRGDSRSQEVNPRVAVRQGEVVATATGVTTSDQGTKPNVFLDFGVYDERTKNKASENSEWLAKHNNDIETHAICWFDLLSKQDEAKIRALPPGDPQAGRTSDYCK